MALNLKTSWTRLTERRSRPASSRRGRHTNVTAIDFAGERLHVVQAGLRNGVPRVLRHTSAPLDRPADAHAETGTESGPALAAALARTGIRPSAVVMGVPRARVMLRILDLPPADHEDEIAAMVRLRLHRDLPFDLDEAIVDFLTLSQLPPSAPSAASLGRPNTGTTAAPVRVLAAVVRRETIEHYQSLAKAAGIKLAGLGLRSLAIAQAARCCHPEAGAGCVALVSVHRQEVQCDVLSEGALVFSRVGALSANSEPQTQPAHPTVESDIESVLTEVARSFHGYEGIEDHHRITRCLVTGTTGAELALAEALARQWDFRADVLDPSGALSEAASTTEFLPHALPAIGLALGALEPDGLALDFLSPKRPRPARDNRLTRRLGVAAGILAVLLTAVAVRAHWIGSRERRRADLQEQIALGSKNLGAYRLVRNQARALSDWSAAGRNWLDHLTALSALLPPSPELYVTALSTSTRNTLNLAVKIRSGETVDRLTQKLRAAGYEVKAPAIMPSVDRFGFRFQANLELTIPSIITNDLDNLEVESRPLAPHAAPGTATTPVPAPEPAQPPPPADSAAASPPDPAPLSVTPPSDGSAQPDPETQPRRPRRRRPEGGWRE